MRITDQAGRFTQIIYVAVFILSACFTVYYLLKWLRGDPDGYPNEVLGGLTTNTTLALLTASRVAPSRRLRWILAGLTALLLPLTGIVVFGDASPTPLMVAGLAVIVGSITWAAYVLWPREGGFASWSTMPATLKQRRALLASVAFIHLGFAMFLASVFDLTRGPWDATVVAVLVIVMFVGAAAAFLILRRRLRA